jgi:hypothetical protein
MGSGGHLYSGVTGKARWFVRRFGWREIFLKPLRKIFSAVIVPLLADRHFTFRSEKLKCHYAHYNVTWSNERCVEIPLGQHILAQANGPALEVGHVLGHYGTRGHTVIDKFESAPGVLNEDITEWEAQTGERFALILSLSTFEHIGFDDEAEGDSAKKIRAAIAACRALLAADGRLVITVPLGYNPHLDELIETDTLGEDRASFLLRSGPREWAEVARAEAVGTRFGCPFPYANALMVAEFNAPS